MKKVLGFTLVELMVVIGVAALLVSLAIPSYHSSVRKARRGTAQSMLTEFSGMAERIYTQDNDYGAATAPDDAEIDDYYVITVVVAEDELSWTATATPTDIQAYDQCGTITLTNTGARTNSGDEGDCPSWE